MFQGANQPYAFSGTVVYRLNARTKSIQRKINAISSIKRQLINYKLLTWDRHINNIAVPVDYFPELLLITTFPVNKHFTSVVNGLPVI